jgi:hypothetical protein
MRPLLLTAQTDAVLSFIRRTEFPLSVYGRSAARVWPMVREQVNLAAEPRKFLRMAAADLVDFYEAKALHGDVLVAIASTLFGIHGSH